MTNRRKKCAKRKSITILGSEKLLISDEKEKQSFKRRVVVATRGLCVSCAIVSLTFMSNGYFYDYKNMWLLGAFLIFGFIAIIN